MTYINVVEPEDYRNYDLPEDGKVDLVGLMKEDGSLTEDGESIIHLAFELIGEAAHRTAVDKGWYSINGGRDFVHESMLFVTEIAEAVEEYRNDNPIFWYDEESGKPEGIGPELGDVIIRIGDSANGRGYDVGRGVVEKLRFNRTRPARHGGKLA